MAITRAHLYITIKKINSYTGATECNYAFICMQITQQFTQVNVDHSKGYYIDKFTPL